MLKRLCGTFMERNKADDVTFGAALVLSLTMALFGGLMNLDSTLNPQKVFVGVLFAGLAWAAVGSIVGGLIGSIIMGLIGIVLGILLLTFPFQTLGVLGIIGSFFLFRKMGQWLQGRNVRKAKRELESALNGLGEVGHFSDLESFKTAHEIILHFLATPGFSALKPKAEAVLVSLPSLAREIRSMSVASSATSSDINKLMYELERVTALDNLSELANAFTHERLRLEEAGRVEKAKTEPKALSLPTIAVFAELTEDVLRTVEAVKDTEEVTLPETALEREFREMTDKKTLPFPHRQTGG